MVKILIGISITVNLEEKVDCLDALKSFHCKTDLLQLSSRGSLTTESTSDYLHIGSENERSLTSFPTETRGAHVLSVNLIGLNLREQALLVSTNWCRH